MRLKGQALIEEFNSFGRNVMSIVLVPDVFRVDEDWNKEMNSLVFSNSSNLGQLSSMASALTGTF